MKLWGCILVFASGAGLGLWGSRLLKKRVEELGETAFFLSFISQELESTLAFCVYAKGASGLRDITVSLKLYK